MSEERALVTRQSSEVGLVENPIAIIARATEQANALMDVVEKRKLYTVIDGKKYLGAEAWETICAFNNASPITDWVRPLERDGETVGYEAKVDLWRNGERIGGAIMPCGLDEFPCRGKEGSAKEKAAKSAAQTWALSKASRMKFSYVAVLAGFEPTPAEEMERQVVETQPRGHWCAPHQTVWFKKGKMRNFAHPIKGADGKDTGEWCNEPVGVSVIEAEGLVEEMIRQGDPGEEAEISEPKPRRQHTKAELLANLKKGMEKVLDVDEQDRFIDKFPKAKRLEDLSEAQLKAALVDLKQVADMKASEDARVKSGEMPDPELPY